MYIRRLQDFKNWVCNNTMWCDPIALDTETTSLNYYDLEIDGFSLANNENSCYVDLFNNPQKENILQELQLYIEDIPFMVIMHNAPFDLKVLYKYGIEPKRVFCTMTAQHLLDENGPKGLKDLAHLKLKIPKQCIKSYEDVEKNTEEFYRYAENDAKWTWQLYQRQLPQLQKEGLEDLFWNVEMPFQFVLRDLAILGMEFDEGKRNEVYYDLRHTIYGLESSLLAMCDGSYQIKRCKDNSLECTPSINFSSSKQLIAVAENTFDLEITERTPKGNKSFGKDTLVRLAGHPFIDLLAKYRAATKLMNTFVEPMPDYADQDNRIRASFNNCVAVTGRLSCNSPNLEQLARNSEFCNVRDMFTAGPGKVLVVADYSGQELVVLAEETQDEKLLDTICNDKDIHLMVANQVFNLFLPMECFQKGTEQNNSASIQYKDQRHSAKNGIVFPVVYGSTAFGIAKYFGIFEAKAQEYLDSFLNLYPGIRESIEKTKHELNRQEYVVDMFGRRRRFPGYRNMWKGHKAKAERQAFNFKIQSPSATMIRRACNKLWQYPTIRIVNIVHDEIVVETEECLAEGIVETIRREMTTDTGLSIPIGVEISYGKRYGECK